MALAATTVAAAATVASAATVALAAPTVASAAATVVSAATTVASAATTVEDRDVSKETQFPNILSLEEETAATQVIREDNRTLSLARRSPRVFAHGRARI